MLLLCPLCRMNGFCRNLSVELVEDRDLDNSEYIRDLRAFAFGLSINDEDWHERLSNFYRDYQGWVVGAEKREVFLDMEEFEREHIREWFRDFCCTPCPSNVVPRVRPEARERVRILATVLKAHFPRDAMLWGVRAANDNCAPNI